jgi:hypothetical protein
MAGWNVADIHLRRWCSFRCVRQHKGRDSAGRNGNDCRPDIDAHAIHDFDSLQPDAHLDQEGTAEPGNWWYASPYYIAQEGMQQQGGVLSL